MKNETIIAAAKKIGRKKQINIAIEELSELIQALCKLNRKGSEVEYRCRLMDIHEEIADVEIAITQLKLSFEMDPAVKSWKEVKLERLARLLY